MHIKELQDMVVKFRDDRDWKQFHKPKDSALSLMLEVAELIEHFQWKNLKEVREYIKANKKEIGEELADILFWVLLISYDLKIDIIKAFKEKMIINSKKYPIEKSKGKHTKYNRL